MGEAVLVTGAAGFIGYHLAEALLAAGRPVLGVDSLNAYYDPALKEARLDRLRRHEGFRFDRLDTADREATAALFARERPEFVVHLAAQAGVRHSIDHPMDYADANLTGFLTVLEGCRHAGTRHLVYASSSSVYGGNAKTPFSETDSVDHPVSLYAATKKANELMAHTYAHLYGLRATGLRFFTVYGPWGRPDMAYYKFTRALFEGRSIPVFNHGRMERDFTYIDDVVKAVARLVDLPACPDAGFDPLAPNPASSWAPHRVYNIGNRRPEKLMDMIAILECETGREAVIDYRDMQPGDVVSTAADVDALEYAVGFRPETPLTLGLARFVDWYRDHHGV
jgi:UDP-glucuronate 4-epimerase